MGSNIIRQKLISCTRENLSGLKNLLAGLKAGKSDTALFEDTLRSIQFIKETSRMMGYESVAEISGEMESLFGHLCNDQLTVTPELTEVCFNAVDYIKDILSDEHILTPGDILFNEELKVSFERVKSAGLIASGKPGKSLSEVQQPDNKKSTWHIILNLNKEIIPDTVNLVNIFHNLFSLGEYKIYKQSSEGDINQCWSIFLSTYKGFTEIESTLSLIKGNCRIFKIADYDIFNREASGNSGEIENNGSSNLTGGASGSISNNGDEVTGNKPVSFIRQVNFYSAKVADRSMDVRMIRNDHNTYIIH